MTRLLLMLAMAAAMVGLTACVGDTDPATRISTISAQLNAHGRTDDGPATGGGSTTPSGRTWAPPTTPRYAATRRSGSQVRTGRITQRRVAERDRHGLQPSTTYFFRACGQDQGEGPTCGRTLSFEDARRNQLHLRPQVGQLRLRERPVLQPPDRHRHRRQRLRRRYRQQPHPEVQSQRGFSHQVGQSWSGNSQFQGPQGVGTDSAGASTSPTPATTASRSSPRPAPSRPPGGRQDPITGSSTGPVASPPAPAASTSPTPTTAASRGSRPPAPSSANGAAPGRRQRAVQHPAGIEASSGGVYVADSGNHRIQLFSSTGAFVHK